MLANQDTPRAKLIVIGMRMLRWMYDKTWNDGIRNEHIKEHLDVASIGYKLREARLRWFGHVRLMTTLVRNGFSMRGLEGKGVGQRGYSWK